MPNLAPATNSSPGGRREPWGGEPEYSSVRLIEVRASEGSTNCIEGYAQLYGQINDRNEIFMPGCAAKTIQEQVPAGRVKVNDGHAWMACATHGVVTEAREDPRGLWFRAKWSAAQDSQDLKTKMQEGILDEWSIEWNSVMESYERVGEGADYFRIVKEFRWRGLALVPHSSQGEATTLSVNSSIRSPYYDLPLAPIATQWDANSARARVIEWANGSIAKMRRAFVASEGNPFAGGGGMQIADIVDGKLMAVPDALFNASLELMKNSTGDRVAIAQSQDHLGRYLDRVRTELNHSTVVVPWNYSSVDALLAEAQANGGTMPEARAAEAIAITTKLFQSLPVEARATINTNTSQQAQGAGPGTAPPTTATSNDGNSGKPAEANASKPTARLQELELLELELAMLST